ncbi:MAG: NAD-dependent epimerase/dehydratase family protein [Candidatus Cloacimonetes bacterium]|nr:NAD-dependent epimerase/dehydratase family protein [Candidatus Cloacimonadota bacterium]
MKVLVTGGAGFIGSNLTRKLLNTGHEVVVLDNFSTGFPENLHPDCQLIQGDVGLKETWDNLETVDVIYHLAAMVSVPVSMNDPIQCQRDNVDSVIYLIDYAKKHQVSKVILASSAAVYGDKTQTQSELQLPAPKSPYGVSKLMDEHLLSMALENFGLPFVAFRMFNIFGPYQSVSSAYASVIPIFITKALKNQDLTIYGDGLQTRDFVYVQQVVDYYIQAMTSKVTGVFNLGNGGSLNILDLAEKIIRFTDSESKIEHKEIREGDIRVSQAEIDHLTDNFTKIPIDFEDSLMQSIKYYRDKI